MVSSCAAPSHVITSERLRRIARSASASSLALAGDAMASLGVADAARLGLALARLEQAAAGQLLHLGLQGFGEGLGHLPHLLGAHALHGLLEGVRVAGGQGLLELLGRLGAQGVLQGLAQLLGQAALGQLLQRLGHLLLGLVGRLRLLRLLHGLLGALAGVRQLLREPLQLLFHAVDGLEGGLGRGVFAGLQILQVLLELLQGLLVQIGDLVQGLELLLQGLHRVLGRRWRLVGLADRDEQGDGDEGDRGQGPQRRLPQTHPRGDIGGVGGGPPLEGRDDRAGAAGRLVQPGRSDPLVDEAASGGQQGGGVAQGRSQGGGQRHPVDDLLDASLSHRFQDVQCPPVISPCVLIHPGFMAFAPEAHRDCSAIQAGGGLPDVGGRGVQGV